MKGETDPQVLVSSPYILTLSKIPKFDLDIVHICRYTKIQVSMTCQLIPKLQLEQTDTT